MTVLLDTDHLSILQIEEQPATTILRGRLASSQPDEVVASIVSFQEQAQGWLGFLGKAKKPAEVLRGYAFLLDLLKHYSVRTVLPFDQPAMEEFLKLKAQRIRIGTHDLRIAAIAKSRGLKLLSRNLRDFRQIPNLDVEDWTA